MDCGILFRSRIARRPLSPIPTRMNRQTGRLQSATQAGHVATYGYRSNTNWEATIAYNDGTSDLFTKRTLRDIGGRIAGVTSRAGSAAGGAILASAGYQLDSKGRRTSLTREDGTKWDFGYNDRDEVTSGDKKLSNGNLLAGRQFEYEYDDMGNRQKLASVEMLLEQILVKSNIPPTGSINTQRLSIQEPLRSLAFRQTEAPSQQHHHSSGSPSKETSGAPT